MDEREQVRREGGVFSINNAPEFLQEGGLRAKLVLTPNSGTRMVGLTAGFHEPGQTSYTLQRESYTELAIPTRMRKSS
jgi:hypothetical protein